VELFLTSNKKFVQNTKRKENTIPVAVKKKIKWQLQFLFIPVYSNIK